MKNFLYWLLSAQTFFKVKKNKVYSQSNLFTAMSLFSFIGTIPIGMGLGYGISSIFLIPFILTAFLFVSNKYLFKVASKELQDKHWRTQLARFKNPKFAIQKALYPGDVVEREKELEELWEKEYGSKFENTSAPIIRKFRILLLIILPILGILLGNLLQ